jgi:predicted RNA-binding protein with PUA-like domain
MPKRYWLMKCEPAAYTIDDLARDGRTGWEGVRNYQARNFIRDDMTEGDDVLFYASNADPSGVTGLARIARAGYPDPFAFTEGHKYFDAASRPDQPTWYTVDIAFVERFPEVVALDRLKQTKGLEQMMVVQKGSRLSIQPVRKSEFEIVTRIGRGSARQRSSR